MRTQGGNVASIVCEESLWQLLKGKSQLFVTLVMMGLSSSDGKSGDGVAIGNSLVLKMLYLRTLCA